MEGEIKRKRGRPRKVQPIVESPAPASLPPGTKYFEIAGDGTKIRKKVRWTMKDVVARFPMVEVFPEETLTITWNGVSIVLREGQQATIPQPHADIYQQHQRLAHEIRGRKILIVEGQPVHILPNTGGLGD